ncbi:cation-translocating P-type ATPase [Tibeticola sp.]|uniref:heavy metal translocating P-type ATPase n=1 Tax=Tibeticola sp. TaxID=2005368 RepID=UPI002588CC31|nr:cation-translocating P-type ATPase [Tibeticola sp.]MCI4441210.1 cation-translocating P-type ATPase [Tibeticola sp.]
MTAGATSPLTGLTAEPPEAAQVLPLLDDPAEWSAFSRPVPDKPGCWESSVVFEGMHCAACALTIEDALRKMPGVESVQVSSASHRGRIVWGEAAVKPSQWMEAAQRAGYRAIPANDAFLNERRKNEMRQAVWRLGVAGLCMMQVMMYAWPVYVAEPGDMAPDLRNLLRWASWVLSLPVLIFSCGPFFQNALRDLRERRISMDLPVALGMLITFAVSTAGTFDPNGIFGAEVYFDSFTMFVFFLLAGRWLELRMRDRTAGALEALMNRLPDSVERQRPDGSFERVAVRRLQVGDVVRVRAGEAFPADGVLVEGETMVDEGLLTGESRPVAHPAGSSVIAGSHNLTASVLMRVERTGEQTRFAQIVALMDAAATSKPSIARLADRIAKPFLVGVLLAAGAAVLYWWPQNPGHALMVGVAVLIVTCPCALSLATPAAMLASAGALARRGVLVRRLEAIETLASVDWIVFDKTGTLTRDAFALQQMQARPGISPDEALAWAAGLARHSLHPVSRALVAAAAARGLSAFDVVEVQEQSGLGVQARPTPSVIAGTAIQGALRLGSAAFCGVVADDSDTLKVYLADEAGWLASFELREALRPDAAATVEALRGLGLQVRILSGDRPAAVRRVAAELGLGPDEIQGGCLPEDKLAALQRAQKAGHRVAMVGDGLNDGPVLAGAHVAFSLGQSVPLTQSKSDFIVLGERLGPIAQAVEQSRRTLQIVRQNLWWAVGYNALCVPLAIFGWLPAWLAGLGMAASSLFVVLNALRLSRPEAHEVLGAATRQELKEAV